MHELRECNHKLCVNSGVPQDPVSLMVDTNRGEGGMKKWGRNNSSRERDRQFVFRTSGVK